VTWEKEHRRGVLHPGPEGTGGAQTLKKRDSRAELPVDGAQKREKRGDTGGQEQPRGRKKSVPIKL